MINYEREKLCILVPKWISDELLKTKHLRGSTVSSQICEILADHFLAKKKEKEKENEKKS